jgi:hypothetical protein
MRVTVGGEGESVLVTQRRCDAEIATAVAQRRRNGAAVTAARRRGDSYSGRDSDGVDDGDDGGSGGSVAA